MEKPKDSWRLVFMAWELRSHIATGFIQGQSLPRENSKADAVTTPPRPTGVLQSEGPRLYGGCEETEEA